MQGVLGVGSSAVLGTQPRDNLNNLFNGLPVESLGTKIGLNNKWATPIRRLNLNLSGSSGNLDKPNAVVICSRMRNLQLRDTNAKNLGLETLNDMVNVAQHCMPNEKSSATRPTRTLDCNLDAMAGFAAAHG
jgi:hypothetical protein